MTAQAKNINLWSSPEHALDYLRRADTIPHRTEGERTLLEFIPQGARRILDLGSGAGRLLSLIQAAHPSAEFVAVDFSPTMLENLRQNFAGDWRVTVVEHDLNDALPALAPFDAVVSSFAIHHLAHERKRSLYQEIFRLLNPEGVFSNLEHVASPTLRLHHQYLAKLRILPPDEDPSNQLLEVESQLAWLREIGFEDVDCHWKWRELALLVGLKPAS